MNPRDITSDDEFNQVIDNLPFASQLDRKHLYVQYNYMLSSVFDVLSESITRGDDELSGTVKLLKTFVNEQTHCNALVRLLSLCVSFPVSEAIVESWGSTISHYYDIKHNPGEPNDDLKEPGTVDKLTFIRLNGPPPGKASNKKLFESALCKHFNSVDYARHFINSERFSRVTSKVVTRILNADECNVLPCYR